MRVLIQRVLKANVKVNDVLISEIGKGLLLLVGIENADSDEDVIWLSNKIVNMRIFSDLEGHMNFSLNDVQGEILVVSQFTLHANTKKGNRPSFIQAARPEHAVPLYESMIRNLKNLTQNKVVTGEFGADMQVALVNDGPVTIWMDSKRRDS
jgi:D-tyrosyl-tRNA(Tyr) deacylase